MSSGAYVNVSVEVAVDPATAFEVFTQEVDAWWKRGPKYRFQPDWSGTMRFEPGVGGRLLHVFDDATGDAFEVGRVRVWEPAERLVVEWRLPNFAPHEATEVEVRFQAVDGGTRVAVEHRGLEKLPADHPARHGVADDAAFARMQASHWADLLEAFPIYLKKRSKQMTAKVKPVPDGAQMVTPYLCIKGAAAAIDFYKKCFGATESAARVNGPDGRVGHAEIEIGGSTIMLADEHPEIGALSPASLGGSPVMLYLRVEDVDATTAAAVAAGAKLLQPAENKFYGDRTATIEDAYGYRWTLSTHFEDVSPEELERRAAAFYEES